jgi:hypothetical protein
MKASHAITITSPLQFNTAWLRTLSFMCIVACLVCLSAFNKITITSAVQDNIAWPHTLSMSVPRGIPGMSVSSAVWMALSRFMLLLLRCARYSRNASLVADHSSCSTEGAAAAAVAHHRFTICRVTQI